MYQVALKKTQCLKVEILSREEINTFNVFLS